MNKLCFSVIFVVKGAKIYLVQNDLEGLKWAPPCFGTKINFKPGLKCTSSDLHPGLIFKVLGSFLVDKLSNAKKIIWLALFYQK